MASVADAFHAPTTRRWQFHPSLRETVEPVRVLAHLSEANFFPDLGR